MFIRSPHLHAAQLRLSSKALFDLIGVLSTSVCLGVVTAFTSIVITVFYLDTCIRREGLDLHMRLERLCLSAETGRGAVRS